MFWSNEANLDTTMNFRILMEFSPVLYLTNGHMTESRKWYNLEVCKMLDHVEKSVFRNYVYQMK